MKVGTVQSSIGLLTTVEFCSHAFLEGIAIGVSFQLQFGLGIIVAFAVVCHDFCDGISTLALMLNSGNSLKSSIGMLLVDASAPAIGAFTTLFFAFQQYFIVYALAFLFGTFFFIGGGILLPDAYRMNRKSVTVTLFFVGFVLILVFSQLLNF
jgi:zinc transporter ZupT